MPGKEGSLQKAAKITTMKKKAYESQEHPSQTTGRDQRLPTSTKVGRSRQCPRTDTEIGRGECFRETAKTTEDGSNYGKDRSG